MRMMMSNDVKGEEEDDAQNDDVEEEEEDDDTEEEEEEEEEEDRSEDPQVWTHCVGNSRCSRAMLRNAKNPCMPMRSAVYKDHTK